MKKTLKPTIIYLRPVTERDGHLLLQQIKKEDDLLEELKKELVQEGHPNLEAEVEKEKLISRQFRSFVDEAAKGEFPDNQSIKELTYKDEELINRTLSGSPNDMIISSTKSGEIRHKDFQRLNGLNWLNDVIINSYLDLIEERSKKNPVLPKVHCYSSFFYSTIKKKGFGSVRRWTKKIDIFSFDIIFVPLHLTDHWCLAVIDHNMKKISYYDSAVPSEEECLEILQNYLVLEHKDKKGTLLDPSIYITETVKDIPQQMNESDCGVFTLKFAEYISRGAEITFNQGHMAYFRRRMVYELLTNVLCM